MNTTVLIIDDDLQIGNLEQEVLEKAGHRCLRAYSGTEALLLLEKEQPDLILLDLMLPGLSGEALLPKINRIPVIVVSAKIGVEDKIQLLGDGAVDYITKPFHTGELLARVEVQLRRHTENSALLHCGDIVVDTIAHSVTVNGQAVALTKTEYAILKLLMQNTGRVIAKSAILDRIGTDTPDCTESSLKTHICHLRQKLREAGDKEYIEAVWGIGFKMAEQ